MINHLSVVAFDWAAITKAADLATAESCGHISRRERLSDALYERIICAFAVSRHARLDIKRMLKAQGLI